MSGSGSPQHLLDPSYLSAAEFTILRSDADSPAVPPMPLVPEDQEDLFSRLAPFPDPQRPLTTDDRSRLNTSKVAIPRASSLRLWSSNRRVSKACETCREQKVKCSGHQPACLRCQQNRSLCVYDDSKRQKKDKELRSLTSQVQVYEALLRDICLKADPDLAEYIEKTLNQQRAVGDESPSQEASKQPFTPTTPFAAPVPFLGGLDYTNEDFNRDMKTQAMGFVGGHSVLAWLYRLKRMLEQSSSHLSEELDDNSVASVNFFVDDTVIPPMDNVDVTQRPPPSLANSLVERYFQAVHPSFPIISKTLFLNQLNQFYYPTPTSSGLTKQWVAILNLIFAIAWTHLSLEQLLSASAPLLDNGFSYFQRAWKLSMSDGSLLDHPNLQQVQVEGLISFYLMSIGQINRSWRICGVAMRTAITMGLNLRSESTSITPVSKETRYRIWWSLYMLDTSLCVMTGRPPASNDAFCTTPRPVPFKEDDFGRPEIAPTLSSHEARQMLMTMPSFDQQNRDPEASPGNQGALRAENDTNAELIVFKALECFSPNISLYFLLLIDLVWIMRESVEKLYAPEAAQRPWFETERIVSMLNSKTDAWLARLPSEFHFLAGSPDFERERSSLAFRFYKTKILITQPCLSRATSRSLDIVNTPGTFCQSTATMCVDLAINMLDLFPSDPDVSWIYHVSPWWCLLHYLMQATGVLLTELFLRAQPDTMEYRRLVYHLVWAARWLANMSTRDLSAKRAWLQCRDLLSNHSPQLEAEVLSAIGVI